MSVMSGALAVCPVVLSAGLFGVRKRDGRGGSGCAGLALDAVVVGFSLLWFAFAARSGMNGRSGSPTMSAVETTPAANAPLSKNMRVPRPLRRSDRE